MSFTVVWILIFIFGCICVLGTIGNFLSVLCLWKISQNSLEMTNSQKTLMSLVVSDFLVSSICCPIQIVGFFWKLNIHGYLVATLCGVSSLTLILLAFEKYVKLTRFTTYHHIMSPGRVKLAIIACWLLPTVSMTSVYWSIAVYGLCNFAIMTSTLVSLPMLYFHIFRFYKESRRTVRAYSNKLMDNKESMMVQNPNHNSHIPISKSNKPMEFSDSTILSIDENPVKRTHQENACKSTEISGFVEDSADQNPCKPARMSALVTDNIDENQNKNSKLTSKSIQELKDVRDQ